MKSTNNESRVDISVDELKEQIEDDKKTQCSFCGQKFRFAKALQKHEARHQEPGGFYCRTCEQTFTSSEARERHRDKEHKVLRCKICNIRFESDTEYLHHINSLHDGRDRELSMCSVCGKQFRTKGELTHHVTSKCGTIKKYKCSVCLQTLMTAGSLHNHMLRHSGQRTFMCRFCAKTFLTAGQLTVHERIHTQEKAFICEVCNKGFCHRQSLITHSTLHTGIKPYQCEGCGNAFSCVGNLLKHRKTHADSCGKIPLTTHRVKHPATKMKVQVNTPPASKLRTLEKKKKVEEATVQQQDQTKNGTWQQENNSSNSGYSNPGTQVESNYETYTENYNIPELNISGSSEDKNDKLLPDFVNALPLESTMSVKHENWTPPNNYIRDNQYICDEQSSYTDRRNLPAVTCQQNYNFQRNRSRNEGLVPHQMKQENSEPDDGWSDNENGMIQCDNVDSEVSEDSVDLYTRWMKMEEKKKLGKFKNKKRNRKRKSSVERAEVKKFIEERGFDDEKGLNCKYCAIHYSIPLWLLKHERKHEQVMKNSDGRGIVKCCCCNSWFESKEECSTHQQCQHADQLTCKECDRLFANPDSMKAHINFYHKGVPRKKYIYVCEKCGKVFKQKALLLSHEQSNCGEGPLFQCTVCEKSFTSKHVQKSHMRIHMPEKSLLCKFCGKSFHWKGQLKIHERSHTGERPFKCQYCPKAFSYRESLITHSTLHTGIKPHLCEACGSRFSCIGNLLKHKRTHANTCGLSSRMKTEVLVS
ncbi:zinc finger protein 30C [Carabus blaptoides fortunei]